MQSISKRDTGVGGAEKQPCILAVYTDPAQGQLVKDALWEQGYTSLVVATREEAFAALIHQPELVILDITRSPIDIDLQLDNLVTARQMTGGISIQELSNCLKQLNPWNKVQKEGVELAQEIQQRYGPVPVIFTSPLKEELKALPFGKAFQLTEESFDRLSMLIEQMLLEHPVQERHTPGEQVVVFERPHVRSDDMLAAA